MTKGANDDVSVCVSTGSLASGSQMDLIKIRYIRKSSDSPFMDDKGAEDDVILCVSTGSLAFG